MSFDPIAQSLSVLNRFSGSELVHKLGLYKPAQKIVKSAARQGFRASSAAVRQFQAAKKMLGAQRLPSASSKPTLFDLNLTEEQAMVRDMAQRFAREAMRPVASEANEAKAAPEGFSAQFAELGLAQFVVPESLGGAATESSVVTQAIVAEDLAHGDMGLAVAALAPVGVASALTRWGSGAQQAKYLPAFAGDDIPKAALCIAEPRPAFDSRQLRTRATADGSGYVLQGEKTLVPLAESAELFLVAADLVDKGPVLFIVEANTPGVSVTASPAMGVRAASLGSVRLDNVRVPMEAIVGESPDAVNYDELIDLSALGWCALAIGTAQAVLDYAIPYTNDRVAFGEPISHRQAVAFMVANIAIEVEGMRLLTWRAASRAELGLSFHREAYLAKAFCADKALEIGTNGVQLLGGAGYIKDHPVERFYRDLMGIAVMEGGVLL